MRPSVSPEISHFGPPPYLTVPSYSGTWIVTIVAVHIGVLILLSSLEATAIPSTQSTLAVQMIPPAPQLPSLQTRENSPATPTPRSQPVEQKRKASPKSAPLAQTQTLAAEAPAGAEASTSKETAQPSSAPAPAAPAASAEPTPVTQPHFNADYLQNPPPGYPALARRMGEEGKVVLRVFVTPDGHPSQIELRTGSGSPRLDRAAQEAVARWKFEPARRGNEAMSGWVLVPIVFNLRG